MQVFDLPNVRCKEEFKGKEYKIHPKLSEVITKCAMNNPLWQFTATQYIFYGDGFCVFEVRAPSGETLGTIERTWSRGSVAICIENDRIKSRRKKGSGYTTVDVDKALLQIKKTFAPMNVLERMGKAKSETHHVMTKLSDRAYADFRHHDRTIIGEANKWVAGTGFPMFLEYLHNNHHVVYQQITESIGKRDVYSKMHEDTKDIWNGLANGTSMLIVKEGSNYIADIKGKVEVFGDDNLPDDWKANLGMLKLVDNDVVVEGVGCRVDQNTFLIKVEVKDEQDNTV